MSYFSDASLVFIPSAQKSGKAYSIKPTDGTGDLTFTRTADTATRVASNGLIEKVRTNLLLQSNSFDNASWTKFGSLTVTGGQAGYDGTNSAWLLTKPAAGFTGLGQSHSNTGIITGSFYLKAGTLSVATIRLIGTPDVSIIFNLATGTIVSGSGFLQRTITSVGNGWYRCTVSVDSTASSTFIVYPDTISATTAGTIFAQAAQLETGDIATDYIATTTAAVSVGPVANVPRLDYLGSSCPRLILEPQRQNVCLWSENFDNDGWGKEKVTITANAVTSPSGYQDADTLTDNSTSGRHRVTQILSATSGTTYTFSVFVKKNSSGRFLLINAASLINARAALDLDTLAVTNLDGTGKVEDYGNGWYRFSVTGTATATSTQTAYIQMQNSASDVNYIGDGSSFYLWGAMLEAGSYVSSYIPSLGAAVTRGADAASKTGISSLIGQTEGTLFADINITETEYWYISLTDGTNQNWVLVGQDIDGGRKLFGLVRSGGTNQASFFSSTINNGRYKIAIAYKSNDIVFYANGTQIGADTSATMPSSLANLYLTSSSATGGVQTVTGSINQTLLFKTRLSNADLAALTA